MCRVTHLPAIESYLLTIDSLSPRHLLFLFCFCFCFSFCFYFCFYFYFTSPKVTCIRERAIGIVDMEEDDVPLELLNSIEVTHNDFMETISNVGPSLTCVALRCLPPVSVLPSTSLSQKRRGNVCVLHSFVCATLCVFHPRWMRRPLYCCDSRVNLTKRSPSSCIRRYSSPTTVPPGPLLPRVAQTRCGHRDP